MHLVAFILKHELWLEERCVVLIESERLRIRTWKAGDGDEFFNLNSDPEVMMYFPSVLTRAESDEFLKKIIDRMEADGYGFWAVEEKSTGCFVGFVGLNSPRVGLKFEPCVEIGWRLKRQHWGKGYAGEGARAVLTYAFDVLSIDRVYSFTATINTRSERLMTRLGMSKLENFFHPSLDRGHRLCEHVLYCIDHPGSKDP